ncbi:hypothetical protein AB7M26_000612 [Pseudomonas sp. F-14 TE3482]
MHNLWRGNLLPLGCEAAPKSTNADFIASASHSNGSRLPRHSKRLQNKGSVEVSDHA